MGLMQAHHHAGARPGTAALACSVGATLALVAAEFLGGFLGRSIALVSDAVHNLSDVPTLVISWFAVRWAERPATPEKTYGYHRAGILAAFTNAILLVLVALYLFYEAYQRLRRPLEVRPGVMIGLSLAALAVNGGITLALVRGRSDLNLRSVLVHNFGDALSNLGMLAGALVIRSTGAHWVDPAIGAAIGALVLWSSYGILKESSHILLEGLPRDIQLENVARTILRVPGVQEVHDIHIWTLGTDLQALSCHVCVPDMHMEESQAILARIRERLESEFRITHTTIQFERAGLPRAAGLYMPAPLDSSK
ncbi:MAG TPA: cation diffusion facilitator family transporter [Candidatus Acidoferrales bacterium]|nr:cation diffusion facilitator family transporter [Candidatus Acidoferrales bacterium]